MAIKFKLVVDKLVVKELGLSRAEVRRINRSVANTFTRTLRKEVPRDIAKKNKLYINSFRKTRAKTNRAVTRGGRGRRNTASFWSGHNDVLLRFKKGAFKEISSGAGKGAGKGNHWVRGAFLATFKSGHKGVFVRTGGTTRTGKAELREVRVKLKGYDGSIRVGLAKAKTEAITALPKLIKHQMKLKKNKIIKGKL